MAFQRELDDMAKAKLGDLIARQKNVGGKSVTNDLKMNYELEEQTAENLTRKEQVAAMKSVILQKALEKTDGLNVYRGPVSAHNIHSEHSNQVIALTCDREVASWLRTLHLQNAEKYLKIFAEHEIDMQSLKLLRERDLRSMGITAVGATSKILFAIKELQGEDFKSPVYSTNNVSEMDFARDVAGVSRQDKRSQQRKRKGPSANIQNALQDQSCLNHGSKVADQSEAQRQQILMAARKNARDKLAARHVARMKGEVQEEEAARKEALVKWGSHQKNGQSVRQVLKEVSKNAELRKGSCLSKKPPAPDVQPKANDVNRQKMEKLKPARRKRSMPDTRNFLQVPKEADGSGGNRADNAELKAGAAQNKKCDRLRRASLQAEDMLIQLESKMGELQHRASMDMSVSEQTLDVLQQQLAQLQEHYKEKQQRIQQREQQKVNQEGQEDDESPGTRGQQLQHTSYDLQHALQYQQQQLKPSQYEENSQRQHEQVYQQKLKHSLGSELTYEPHCPPQQNQQLWAIPSDKLYQHGPETNAALRVTSNYLGQSADTVSINHPPALSERGLVIKQELLENMRKQKEKQREEIKYLEDQLSQMKYRDRVNHNEIPKGDILFDEADLLGEGTFCQVFRGTYRNSEVAVKRLQVPLAAQDRNYFTAEVNLLQELRHPRVVLLLGASTKTRLPLMVLEFMSQGSLHEYLHDSSRPPLNHVSYYQISRDVALGMNYLHRHKPVVLVLELNTTHILLGGNGRAKVSGFGFSKLKHDAQLAASTSAACNPAWMAPELLSNHDVTTKADVYSYGIVLWEMLTRQIPYDGLSMYQVLERVRSNQRPSLPPSCPESLSSLISKCWHQTPGKRPHFKDILDMLEDLSFPPEWKAVFQVASNTQELPQDSVRILTN
ncbi:probable serine/threonine-protein kinase drkD [Lingula anatina]|uniref:Probable serine/threonine-protein kinase drkD n=1 Tax=Lingula anatina TaxID=7574 RepID=A0A1S3J6K7_LINAN|nr:probable serine/threonine-protein kinase drkD [Lingula anatina]|eukprot:XP_013405886.2 probable serine/threonine-protein kinase drkD [Lingula anatina]